MKTTHSLAIALLLSAMIGGAVAHFALAGPPMNAPASPVKVATAAAAATPSRVARGGKGTLAITIRVAPNFHINAHRPKQSYLIATSFTGRPMPGITFGAPRYPKPKAIIVSYEKQPMLVYTGKAVITVPFTVAASARPGPHRLSGTLTYQGCNDKSCYPPGSLPVQTAVTIQ